MNNVSELLAYPDYIRDIGNTATTLERHFRGNGEHSPALLVTNDVMRMAYTQNILRRTYRSFNMMTGSDHLPQKLAHDFHAMIERIMQHGGKMRAIILDGSASAFHELKNNHPDGIDLAFGTSRGPQPPTHYFASDSLRLYDEKRHPHLHHDMDANAVEGEMYFANEALANLFNSRFAIQWEVITGQKIEKPKEKKKRWWKY